MAITLHWIDDCVWVVNTVSGPHTCSGFHLFLSCSSPPFTPFFSFCKKKKITHQGRASLSTSLLNSDPQSSSWPWLASLGEPWSGFHKPPTKHTHTKLYYCCQSWSTHQEHMSGEMSKTERDIFRKWSLIQMRPVLSLPCLCLSLSLFVLLQYCLYLVCNCVISCRGLFSDIIRFCGASLSPESKTSNECFTPNLSFIKDDSVAVLFVCESSICVLCPLSNFLTQDKKTFPLPSVSHLSVPLAISLPSFFSGPADNSLSIELSVLSHQERE